MIVRYPDTAKLTWRVPITGSDTGLLREDTRISDQQLTLDGRMELTDNAAATYKAKFFTAQSIVFKDLEGVPATLNWAGNVFQVIRLVPYQTHTVIWLS